MELTLPASHSDVALAHLSLLRCPHGFAAITPPLLLVTSLTLSCCVFPAFFLMRSTNDEDTDSDVTDDGGRIADDDATGV